MNKNKKYAIRKLAVGVASVSIGMFISNIPEIAQTLGSVGGGVIQAFDNGTENMSNETTKNWKPEGNIIAQGEDGVPWELYENGYLLFKPEPGKDTLTPIEYYWDWSMSLSAKEERYRIKAVGSTKEIILPEKSSGLFHPSDNNWPLLKYIDTSKFDTSNVKDLSFAFWNIGSVRELDLSTWNTSKVENISHFLEWEYQNLEFLNISNFDTTNIKNNEFIFKSNVDKKIKKIVIGEKLAKGEALKDINLFEGLEHPFEKNTYTNRWIKEDGSAGPFTVEEWNRAYRNDPIGMSGSWIREKTPTKYTLNFNTDTTEQINSLEVEKDTKATLPTPTVDNQGYKFLGWSKTQDGEVITDTTNIANPSETITLYAKWEKVNNITTERIPIEITTVYQGDNNLNKGQRIEEEGQIGEKEIITTYKTTPITGELTEPTTTENIITPMRPKVIKIGTKPTIVEKRTELPITETQTNTLVRGKERITQGIPKVENEITEYIVNETTGDITETKRTEIIDEGTPTVKEIGTREPVNKIINEQGKELTSEELIDYTEPNYGNPNGVTEEGDPIYNVRRITTTYKGDDTLDKGKQVVEKDGKSDGKKVVKVGTKSTVVVETLPSSVRYEKDDSREKGQENITVSGRDGSKTTTTTYTVDENTGDIISHTQEPVVVEPINTIIKVALKDKVVYSKDGDNIIQETTRYTINETTGDITENTTRETFKENGAKDKVVVEKLPSPVKYEKDTSREKGQENITVQGKDGSKTTTTTYTVNPENGEVETHSQEPVIVKPTETIIKVAAKDKVEYSIGNYIEKEDYLEEPNSVYKKTIVYEVNPENGEITENRKVELYKENVMKPKIIKEERIPSPIRYEKDSSRDKGQENITIQGKDGSKITKTVYSLDVNTGEILSYTPKPEITEPTTTTIKVAAKDKVEIVNKDDGSVVKEITTYTVNEKTGEITETKTEEVIKTKTETSKGQELPPIVDNKDFVGGVNSIDNPVIEELPELKVAIIKDKGNNILDVIKLEEQPKEIKGYKNTGKTEIDKNGYKVYIYEKTEEHSKGNELPPVVENKDFVGGVNPNESPIAETLPELKVAIIKDKENNILDVIKLEEQPKEIKGYKNTGKTEIDKDGYKVYIYEKVENVKQEIKETPTVKENKVDIPKEVDKDNKQEVINKKEELPKTSSVMLSTVGLFSIFGLRKNRKKDK